MSEVTAVVVSYNSRQVVERCLASLAGQVHDVIVVDNASADGTAAVARQQQPDATILELASNRGFGAAANEGFSRATAPFLLLLNADAWAEPGAVGRLVDHALRNPRIGVVGPQLVEPGGALQVSALRFPTALWAGRPAVTSVAAPRRLAARSGRDRVFLVGAAMLIRREAIEEVGGFDTDFFMFGEDIDLCYRLLAEGWLVEQCGDARFVHVGGHSTRQTWEPLFREQIRSHLRFLAKHRGIRAARLSRLVLRASLTTHGMLQGGDRGRATRDAAAWLAAARVDALLCDPRRDT